MCMQKWVNRWHACIGAEINFEGDITIKLVLNT